LVHDRIGFLVVGRHQLNSVSHWIPLRSRRPKINNRRSSKPQPSRPQALHPALLRQFGRCSTFLLHKSLTPPVSRTETARLIPPGTHSRASPDEALPSLSEIAWTSPRWRRGYRSTEAWSDSHVFELVKNSASLLSAACSSSPN